MTVKSICSTCRQWPYIESRKNVMIHNYVYYMQQQRSRVILDGRTGLGKVRKSQPRLSRILEEQQRVHLFKGLKYFLFAFSECYPKPNFYSKCAFQSHLEDK